MRWLTLGETPTSSRNRVEKVPSDWYPTAKHTSVTVAGVAVHPVAHTPETREGVEVLTGCHAPPSHPLPRIASTARSTASVRSWSGVGSASPRTSAANRATS